MMHSFLPRLRTLCAALFRRYSDGMGEALRQQRHRRLAVLGLCAAAALTTGFWANTPERGRGVSAIRMRIDFSALPEVPPLERTKRAASPRLANFMGVSPLSPGRTYFRATIRDVARGGGDADESFAGMKSSPSFMDTLFSMEHIAGMEPDLAIPRWQGSGLLAAQREKWNADDTWIYGDGTLPANECPLPSSTSVAEDLRRLLFKMSLPITPESLTSRSEKYTGMVESAAKRFGLTPQLIYGIMRTESSFNPFAVSNAGALGLMQLVPDTAATEVHNYLGRAGNPTRTLLFDPQNNIEYGSAYLHLLATRYFSLVSNQTSRELCVIAAYNAGPGAVLRLFDTNKDAAIVAINALSPEELFTRLAKDMPAEETRQYIGKVLANSNAYPGG